MLRFLEIKIIAVYILIFYFCQGMHSSTQIRQAYVVKCSTMTVSDVFVQKPPSSLGLLLMTIKQLFTVRDFIGPCPGECPIDPESKIPKPFRHLSTQTRGNLQSDAKVSQTKGDFLESQSNTPDKKRLDAQISVHQKECSQNSANIIRGKC